MSKRHWPFLLGGLLVALLLAGVVSNYASSHPDGLDSSLLKGCTVNADDEITGGSCPAQQAKDHELADSPLADYGVRGIGNDFLSTGLSGVLGVLLTSGGVVVGNEMVQTKVNAPQIEQAQTWDEMNKGAVMQMQQEIALLQAQVDSLKQGR